MNRLLTDQEKVRLENLRGMDALVDMVKTLNGYHSKPISRAISALFYVIEEEMEELCLKS